MRWLSCTVLVAPLIAACASSGPAVREDGDAGTITPPFSAQQIRDATREGRSYTWVVKEGSNPMVHHTVRFLDVSDAGASMESVDLDLDGKPVREPRQRRVTWQELQSHAAFPRAATAVSHVEVEVPAGRFSCRRFAVTDDKEQTVSIYDFATDLPGAPVQMEVWKGEEPLYRMALVKHVPGQ